MPVFPSENLSRFLFSGSHYARTKGTVSYGAFMPKNDEISVFRTSSLSETEIFSIGINYVASPSGRNLHGRADILASGVLEEGLNIEEAKAGEHHLHASVTSWPSEEPKQRLLAGKLAKKAKLKLLTQEAKPSS